MVPTFTRIASKLISVITEDTINLGESKIKIAPYLSKATLDIIGLVGKKIKMKFYVDILYAFFYNSTFFFFFRI